MDAKYKGGGKNGVRVGKKEKRGGAGVERLTEAEAAAADERPAKKTKREKKAEKFAPKVESSLS
jgi:hypothetical protein